MSALRTAALTALEERKEARAAEEATRQRETAEAGVARAAGSPLGKWFPDVKWEWVANLADGTTLVREKDGLDILLGVKIVKDGSRDQGPDTWEVAIHGGAPMGGIFARDSYVRVKVLKEAADLGEYIDTTESKVAPDWTETTR